MTGRPVNVNTTRPPGLRPSELPFQFHPRYGAPDHVTLYSLDPPMQVISLLGENPPTLSGGQAQWAEIERPHRTNATDCTGQSPRRLTFDMFLDGFAEDRSIEGQIAILERMKTVVPGDYMSPVLGVLGRVPGTGIDWVVEDMAFGPAERSENHGHRIRCNVSISLLEFIEPEVIITRKTVHNPVRPNYRLHRVKRGDTCPKLAAKYLKKAKRWREIAKLNNFRGPGIPSRFIGKKIKIPRR